MLLLEMTQIKGFLPIWGKALARHLINLSNVLQINDTL